MNEKEMYTAINKGVPNFVDIELSVSILAKQCASDYDLLLQELKDIRTSYENMLLQRFGFLKSNHRFFDGLLTRTLYKTSENKLYISPKPFIRRLKKIMDVNNPSEDFSDEQLKKDLLSRFDVLKNINTPEELQIEFPLIYDDYQLSFTSMERKKKLFDDQRQTKEGLNEPNFRERIRVGEELYRRYGLDTNFRQFMYKQTAMYRNFIVRRQFVEDVYRQPLDLSKFQGLDKSKFEMYLADRYLHQAELSTDEDEIQRCIFYIATYLRETKINDLELINDETKRTTFKNIVQRYKALLKKHPLARPIDEPRENFRNYHIRHVENHVKKHYSHIEGWVLIPEGEDEDKKQEVRERMEDTLSHSFTHLSKEEKERRIKERFEILKAKKEYYETTHPETRLFGLNTFNGYIAHVYANGNVVLEKFYEDFANYMPAKDEAIYIIKVEDFETLSKFSKLQLVKEPNVRRIYHSGNWQERTDKIISEPVTTTTQEQVKQLLLRCEKK